MAILFGEERQDGKIKVWRTVHTKRVGKDVVSVTKKDYPDGYEFDEMPEYPQPERGKDYVWLYDPVKKEHSFEVVERPLTQEEVMHEINEKLGVLIDKLSEKEGIKR